MGSVLVSVSRFDAMAEVNEGVRLLPGIVARLAAVSGSVSLREAYRNGLT